MTSPPLVYMIHRRTVRVPECTLYSHLRSFRCEDDLLVIYGLQNVIFSSFETQFKVVLLKTDPEHHFTDPHSFKLSNIGGLGGEGGLCGGTHPGRCKSQRT